ncbi:MAG TPA: FHA domain-containing protein [Abditibacterium sp.]|jgi:hypothetical protein
MNLQKSWLESLLTPATLRTVGVGALGGFLAFFVTEQFGNRDGSSDFIAALRDTALWSAAIGVVLGATLLVYDNATSLRGVWHRDLPLGVPLFAILSFFGGVAGQLFYSILDVRALHSIIRAGGWALMGTAVGLGIGAVRLDGTQARRGAIGGLLGGFAGGFLFDGVAQMFPAGGGSVSRMLGLIITGAAIAFGRLLVQEALKSAWLLGISTGPYEGKEAPLTKNRVTVGRDASNDIALFRDETVPPQLGAFVFDSGWKWNGGLAKIDGQITQNAPLHPDSIIELGGAKFRFLDRSRHDVNTSVVRQTAVPTPVAPVRLVLCPASAETTWPIIELAQNQREATIGRAPTSDFVIAQATVSSDHARIFWNSAGTQLRDEHSTNGTSINGEKVAAGTLITLREGDKVSFGRVEYVASR